MIDEKVTISLARYNDLKNKSEFFDSNYIAADFGFYNNGHKKVWVKDEILKNIEDYYNKRILEYKSRMRSRCTLKFWKWKLSLKINK